LSVFIKTQLKSAVTCLTHKIFKGDVHKELNLTDRYGSVDDALGANKFQSMAKVV